MNWYNELKEQGKTAGWFDGLLGKPKAQPGGMRGAPVQRSDNQVILDGHQDSAATQEIKKQLMEVDIEINQARLDMRRNPTAKQTYDQAMQRKTQLLERLEHLRGREYSTR